jgi:hypothetical protein
MARIVYALAAVALLVGVWSAVHHDDKPGACGPMQEVNWRNDSPAHIAATMHRIADHIADPNWAVDVDELGTGLALDADEDTLTGLIFVAYMPCGGVDGD